MGGVALGIQMCGTEHPVVQVACMAVSNWTLDEEMVMKCRPSNESQHHRLQKKLGRASQEDSESLR